MKIMLAYLAPFIDRGGGAEKVCCNMANEMVRRGHDVSIVYCYGKSGRPLFPLNENVRMYNLMALHPEKWHGAGNLFLPRWRKVVRELLRVFSVNAAHGWQENYFGPLLKNEIQEVVDEEKPDVIVSYWPKDSSYFMNYAGIRTPMITMFHFGPDILAKDASSGSRIACDKSAYVQVLLPHDVECVKKYIPGAKAVWIPNVVPQYAEQANLSMQKAKYTIINIGRLDGKSKRQHILIEAFAELASQFPQWQVEIWGPDWNNKYKQHLETLIHQHHLENQIFLRGITNDVLSQYLKADILAWPSKHEGFGMAMTEAMSAGLPVVACQICQASRELLDETCGILVGEGSHSFARGLQTLMENQEKRMAMGQKAKEKMSDFSAEKVWDTWETLIENAAHQ